MKKWIQKPVNIQKKKTRKKTLTKYFLFVFKFFSALGMGLFLATVGQALIHYHYFSFMFICLTTIFGFFAMVKKLTFLGVLMVDLFFVLIIILARLYIIIAHNG